MASDRTETRELGTLLDSDRVGTRGLGTSHSDREWAREFETLLGSDSVGTRGLGTPQEESTSMSLSLLAPLGVKHSVVSRSLSHRSSVSLVTNDEGAHEETLSAGFFNSSSKRALILSTGLSSANNCCCCCCSAALPESPFPGQKTMGLRSSSMSCISACALAARLALRFRSTSRSLDTSMASDSATLAMTRLSRAFNESLRVASIERWMRSPSSLETMPRHQCTRTRCA
mmetsp:Transcript_29962/g.79923  ORF Transcript_29962/g.79923 Transcript_29962/m.79923 type:complete len:230 (+) Transcript_29962:567-1256(+)